ncbi:hypothetical protein OI984_01860 [Enterobacter roggenkampii]|uniref:hypothetical protein n=1 Tax=Enterobacter roggenkampii TaxID=1812935 RepID=UPI002543015F|nr:hypothetical protein [Enterobacter roggenkampii]WIJ49656.1 hypothetical protein OI984_01860 [Enterobacter roggenkampii]
MSVKHNLEQWIAQLDYDDTCDISDRQVSKLIRNYAALEAKCAALAAENAGLIEQSEEVYAAGYNHGHLNTVDGIAYADCVKDDFYGLAVELMREAETPSTDAFLADVRASGADECVRQLAISDDDDFSDAPNVCAMVAHQIRKGAQP